MSFSLKEKKLAKEEEKKKIMLEEGKVAKKEKKPKKSLFSKKTKEVEKKPKKLSVSGEVINDKMTYKKETKLNTMLLNVISPMGIKFSRNDFLIGENKASMFGVVDFPSITNYGYLSKLTSIPGAVTSIHFKSISSGELLGDLRANIKEKEAIAEGTNDYLEKKRSTESAENSKKLLKQIDDAGEKVGLMSTLIMPFSPDDKFSEVTSRVKTKAMSANVRIRNLSFIQENAFKALSPYYTTEKEVSEYLDRVMPLSAFIGGFPFSDTGYRDEVGSYIARDSKGGLVMLDMWKRSNDRTNSNIVIMGMPGVGKSTAIKHIILNEYMNGTKIVIIDPEAEYVDLVKNLDGDIINSGGGKGKINPLQIRAIPKDDDVSDDISDDMPDMALYLKTVETFFKLYLDDSDSLVIATLKEMIIKVYKLFSITFDTDVSNLEAKDFPTIKDLYELILKEKEVEEGELKLKNLEKLEILLKDIAVGADSYLFSGISTIEHSSNAICFDTSDLTNMDAKTKSTQYFNIMTYAWQIMSKSREEKVLLICDEAYLLIDPDVPETLSFVRNIEKRSRKYESAIAVISHSVVDFLAEKVKMQGQAVLDTPTYKFLMGTDGQNLIETKELYKLGDAEEELLEAKKRKHALAMIGSKRLQIVFEIPPYKFEYFGDKGGR